MTLARRVLFLEVITYATLRVMKILVFYRPNSEHARRTEEYMTDLQRMHDVNTKNLKAISIDTREGSSLATIYDILSFPAIVVTDDYGAYIKGWSGDLPLMNEVMSYAITF